MNVHSGGEKNTVISSQLEKLVSPKPHSPSEDNLTNSKPVIRTNSPTKRGNDI